MPRDRGPVALIIPPSPFLLDERVFVSLGVLKVAAALRAGGVAVEVLDLSGVSNYLDAVKEFCLTTPALTVGITATTPQFPAAVRIARCIESMRPSIRRICGGPHPTLVHAALKQNAARAQAAMDQILNSFDVVVCGDGEKGIFEALRQCPPSVVDADDPKGLLFLRPQELSEAPLPARDLVDLESYHYTIEGHKATNMIAQLGCPFGCGFSVTGDTIIFTDSGPQEVATLATGVGLVRACSHGPSMLEYHLHEAVATPRGRAQTTRAVAEGVRPVVRVTVEGGLSVKSTPEHQFLVVQDDALVWKRADALTVHDFVAIRAPERPWPAEYVRLTPPTLVAPPPGGFTRKTHHHAPTVLDETLAWFCGYVVGDGSLPTDNRPAFHVCVTDAHEARLREVVQELFNVELAVSPASNTNHMCHGWVHSRLAREALVQSVGIDPHEKLKIPALFWQSPTTVLAAFIEGLMAADGYIEPDGHSYLVTASERLAKDVAWALLMLRRGCPTISRHVQEGYTPAAVHYRVGVLDNDRIPTTRSIYRSPKSGAWYWRTARGPKRLGVRRRTIRKAGLHHPLDRDGWYYARVRAVEPCLAEPVYDLTVPDEEAFVANGFIAHNCGGRSSPMLRRVRQRSTASVVAEVEHLYRAYQYTGFNFYDDELNVNRGLVEMMRGISDLQSDLGAEFRLRGFLKAQLFTEEQAEAMYAAGFRWVLVGFESGSPRILDNMQKRATREENTRCVEIAHRYGLKVKALMSIGHAGETPETIRETEDWLRAVQPDDFDVTIITPYPGSPYYDEAVRSMRFATGSHGAVWEYTAKSGDMLYSLDVDYAATADYYKGDPHGGYRSYVFTDALASEDLVEARDYLESTLRADFGIPFAPASPATRFEASMGQLPGQIYRRSQPVAL